jgi:hypothetical protein
VIRCGFKNAYHKGIVWFKEIGLRAQNVINQHNWGAGCK